MAIELELTLLENIGLTFNINVSINHWTEETSSPRQVITDLTMIQTNSLLTLLGYQSLYYLS